MEGSRDGFRSNKKLPKLVLVAAKIDLLLSQISPARLDRWVHHCAKANGASKLSKVCLVSAHKDLGMRNLLSVLRSWLDQEGTSG